MYTHFAVLGVSERNLVHLLAATKPRGDAEILEAGQGVRFGPEARVVVQRRKHHLHFGAVIEVFLSGLVGEAREGAAHSEGAAHRCAASHGKPYRILL